jgi:hypothetical protein
VPPDSAVRISLRIRQRLRSRVERVARLLTAPSPSSITPLLPMSLRVVSVARFLSAQPLRRHAGAELFSLRLVSAR